MENKFCQSCGAPLNNPEMKGESDVYCKYCIDEKGELKPKEEIQQGIAGWFSSWQPNVTAEQANKRAENYIKAMPAWADN